MEKTQEVVEEIKQESKLFAIPSDVLKIIFKGFTDTELLDVAVTCKQMHTIISKLYLLTLYGRSCRFLGWYCDELKNFTAEVKNYEASLQVSVLTPQRMSLIGKSKFIVKLIYLITLLTLIYVISGKIIRNPKNDIKDILIGGAVLAMVFLPTLKLLYNSNRDANQEETKMFGTNKLNQSAIASLEKLLNRFSTILCGESLTRDLLNQTCDENKMLFLAIKANKTDPANILKTYGNMLEVGVHAEKRYQTFSMSRSCLRADIQLLLSLRFELEKCIEQLRYATSTKIPASAFTKESQQKLQKTLEFWNKQQVKDKGYNLELSDTDNSIEPPDPDETTKFVASHCSLELTLG